MQKRYFPGKLWEHNIIGSSDIPYILQNVPLVIKVSFRDSFHISLGPGVSLRFELVTPVGLRVHDFDPPGEFPERLDYR